MKNKILATALLASTSLWGEFDFNGCSGSEEFEQQIQAYGGDYENTTLVGTIPTGIKGLKVELTSDQDVDIRLYGENSYPLIHWPDGLLSGPSETTKEYLGAQYTYSGYNGGHEYIEVDGTVGTDLTMKAFGFQAGLAIVKYSWTGKVGCTVEQTGTGHFNQNVLKDKITKVGTIPAGINNFEVNLTSSADLDIQLFGEGNVPLISWNPIGLLTGPGVQTLEYNGMTIEWSGYNGVNGQKGHEYIKVLNATTEAITMKVFGYEEGQASVDYSWGVKDNNTCTSDRDCDTGVCNTTTNICAERNVCGNSKKELAESCDDGNTIDDDGCTNCKLDIGTTGCQTDTDCDNGVCDTTERSSICEEKNVVGNGKVEAGESCDDGNTRNGDGCSSNGKIESGYSGCTNNANCESGLCHTATSICKEKNVVGNGVVEAGESCDDGNTRNGDGCSSNGKIEIGYEGCTNNSDCVNLGACYENTCTEKDMTAPAKPTLTEKPVSTTKNSVSVEVNGEPGATVWLKGKKVATLNNKGKATINLDTSGKTGDKVFRIFLKDDNGNQSDTLKITIRKEKDVNYDGTLNSYLVASQGTTASDNFSSYQAASNAIDDDIYSYNYTNNTMDDNWLQLALPRTAELSKIMIKGRTEQASRLKDALVFITSKPYSYYKGDHDGYDYYPEYENTFVGILNGNASEQWFPLNNVKGQYIIVQARQGQYLHIADIKLYGTLLD